MLNFLLFFHPRCLSFIVLNSLFSDSSPDSPSDEVDDNEDAHDHDLSASVLRDRRDLVLTKVPLAGNEGELSISAAIVPGGVTTLSR